MVGVIGAGGQALAHVRTELTVPLNPSANVSSVASWVGPVARPQSPRKLASLHNTTLMPTSSFNDRALSLKFTLVKLLIVALPVNTSPAKFVWVNNVYVPVIVGSTRKRRVAQGVFVPLARTFQKTSW